MAHPCSLPRHAHRPVLPSTWRQPRTRRSESDLRSVSGTPGVLRLCDERGTRSRTARHMGRNVAEAAHRHPARLGTYRISLDLVERSIVTHRTRKEAVAHSHGLRAQLHHNLELLTDDHPLCQWDGPLLPLEPHDHNHLITHGTDRGYQAHRRHRIPMCDPCRDAHRDTRRHDRHVA